jgi:hypothetical protein
MGRVGTDTASVVPKPPGAWHRTARFARPTRPALLATPRRTLVGLPMTDSEKAAKVIEALKAAEREPPQAALPMLNELAGLVQGEGEAPLEVEEARSSAFMAICEVGKALHRGQPTDALWAPAIAAAERWKSLAR